MRVPNSQLKSGASLAAKRKEFLHRVEKVRIALDMSGQEMAETLGLLPEEYRKFVGGHSDLATSSLYRLIETTKVSYKAFENGSIDYLALSEHRKGNFDFVNPKYLVAAQSKRRVICNILDYVERVYGLWIREQINRHFQISNQVWSEPDKTVNINFVTDLLQFLSSTGIPKERFHKIGSHMIISARNNPLGESLTVLKSPAEVYEQFFSTSVKVLEQNCNYTIQKMTQGSFVAESRSVPWVAEALKLKDVGTPESCQLRSGTMSSLTGFIGLPGSHVVETKCVHRGDPFCRFEIEYPKLLH